MSCCSIPYSRRFCLIWNQFFVKCFAIRVALPPVSSKALIVMGFGLPFLREFILINTMGAVCWLFCLFGGDWAYSSEMIE